MLKRLLSLLLIALTLFSLTACEGEYQFGISTNTSASTNTDTNTNVDDEGYVPPTMNNDPTDDFVVTLKADGISYSPRMDMYAYWSDGFSIHTAKFDKNGVARIDGLDGDYKVTLSEVPNEYTYNPNGNVATNDKRSIEVNLYTLNRLAGGGTGLYDCYSFSKTGVYCATITDPSDAIYFQYAPDGMGTYSIESWVDVTADNINPYVDVYIGSTAWKAYERTIDDGGPIGSYTINFVHEVSIAKENISAGGGQAVYTFVIKAESKNNKYPISITFAVKRDGDFELPSYGINAMGSASKGMITPTYDFTDYDVNDHEYGSDYKLVMPEYQYSGSTYVFDESRYKLWKKSDGGDDFYHVYDELKYADTDGYGPILYAYITVKNRFIDKAFTQVEYDNKGDIVNNVLGAYKHLIEGVTKTGKQGGYYCVGTCLCHTNSTEIWACTSDCTTCSMQCSPCKEELLEFEGYQAYVNSQGMVPVTKDIKNFLLAYCQKQTFFYDGKGTLENQRIDGKYFQAVGDSGWLFGCAYYEAK